MTCYVINRRRAQNLNIARELRTKQPRRNVTMQTRYRGRMFKRVYGGYVYNTSLSSHQRTVALR